MSDKLFVLSRRSFDASEMHTDARLFPHACQPPEARRNLVTKSTEAPEAPVHIRQARRSAYEPT